MQESGGYREGSEFGLLREWADRFCQKVVVRAKVVQNPTSLFVDSAKNLEAVTAGKVQTDVISGLCTFETQSTIIKARWDPEILEMQLLRTRLLS